MFVSDTTSNLKRTIGAAMLVTKWTFMASQCGQKSVFSNIWNSFSNIQNSFSNIWNSFSNI